jgi:hypothetical protein
MGFLKKPTDKYELRAYLQEIDLKDSKDLEARAREVVGNIFRVMDRYRELPDDHPLRKYYELPLRQIELAYMGGDFKKSFPQAIRHLLISITWE